MARIVIASEKCRVRGLIVLTLLLLTVGTAAAQYALSPPGAGSSAPTACQLRLAKLAQFQHLPMVDAPGACGVIDPVLLQSVILPDGAKVAIAPPATLRCTMAEAIANWLREDVTPAALKLAAPLRGLENLDSYDCRSRNRVPGAILSEHARANALDVGGFRLADGRLIGLTDVHVAKEWREAVRATACARFTTVLGPGSDGYHEEHIHLDLAERHGGYKMCQWDVREPVVQAQAAEPSSAPTTAAIEDPVPLPRPRPVPHANLGIRPRPMKIAPQLR
jgi:hypothetical protein